MWVEGTRVSWAKKPPSFFWKTHHLLSFSGMSIPMVVSETMHESSNSADDQDYCEYIHTVSAKDGVTHSVREVTVKSFSMATRLKRPGFQLLSLFSPPGLEWTEPSYADAPCLLPNQSRIYTHAYAPLLSGSLLLLLVLNLRRPRPPHLRNHMWHDPIALHAHESLSSSDPSPITLSPPASPIHFKSSHSHSTVLRSASTLTPPNVSPSQPATPLGGTPLLTPSFRPLPGEDDGAQEVLFWPKQTPTPMLSPYLEVEPRGVDSSYFLPSPDARSVVYPKKSIWLTNFRPRTRLTVRPRYLSALVIPFVFAGQMLLFGGPRRAHTWHGRFVQDVVHVSLLPTSVFIVISVWLSR